MLDYTASLDHLLQYFDKRHQPSDETGASTLQNFQYASLNLASFFARFGHRYDAS